MKRLWGLTASLRTTAWLLALLALLLLLNVALPQSAVMGDEPLRRLVAENPAKRFLLVTLGFGSMPTSPVFLGVLGLFFLNLLFVLADRTGPTLRQVRMRSVPEDQLLRQTDASGALAVDLPEGWSARDALVLLKGHGYRGALVGSAGAWGAKNRLAPLGFLAFHCSFLLLCVGGALLYYTRSVGVVRLSEGQAFDGRFGDILRRAPVALNPPPPFELRELRAAFSKGEPTDLEADLRFRLPSGVEEATSRVNHPASVGATAVLVEEVGVAPELWLQDPQGYTVDRVSVAAATRGDQPTKVPLAGGRLMAVLQPLWRKPGLPDRKQLADLPLMMSVFEAEAPLFEGLLLPGRPAQVGPNRLLLVRHRYWGGFRIVTERGGGLLISGFTLAMVGLLWRMLAYRREVFLSWGDGVLKLAGRGEFFPGKVRDELESIARMAAALTGPRRGAGPDEEAR